MKTVGVAGGAAVLPTAVAAAEVDRAVGDGLNPASGRRQEAVIVFADRDGVDRLDDLDLPAGSHAFETLPMAYAELDGDQIREVAGWESTMRVVDNRTAEYDNHDSKEDTRAREVWEREDLGLTGENVHVAIIDSGLDSAHPGHHESVESNYMWAGEPTSGEVLWQDVSPGNNDGLGHGTHVAGSITGSGDASVDGADYAGMAPDATLTSYGAPMLGLTRATRVAAYDHIIAGNRNGDHDIQVVSNSWTWGNEYDPWNPVPRAVWEATKEGVLTLFSAGNAGPDPETLNETKDPFVLSVGATDGEMAVADFSSRGVPGGSHDREETLRNITRLYEETLEPGQVDGPIELERPGVAAKGDTVMSTQSPDSGYYALGALDTPISVPPDPADPPVDDRGAAEPLYGTLSGTSMSCPTTAGVVALFLDAYHEEHGAFPTPIETITTMEATAREDAHGSYLRTNVGAGYVDAVAAVEAALDADGLPPGLDDREELPPRLEGEDLPPGLAKRDAGLPGFDDVTLADPHPDADEEGTDDPGAPEGEATASAAAHRVSSETLANGSPAWGSPAVAGTGVLATEYTAAFEVPEGAFEEADEGTDADLGERRLLAEATWNETDAGPTSMNLFVERQVDGGWEVVGFADGGDGPTDENRLELEVRDGAVYDGDDAGGNAVENVARIDGGETYRFGIQPDSGVGDFEVVGVLEAYTVE